MSVNLNFVTEHHLYPSSVIMEDKVCKVMTVCLSKLKKVNSKTEAAEQSVLL